MNELLEAIFRLDASGRHVDTLQHLRQKSQAPEVAHEIYALLIRFRFLEAYVLAQLFRGVGMSHAFIEFARAIGGFLFGNPADEAQGTAALSAILDALPEDKQMLIARSVVHPVISQIVMSDASIVNDYARALRLLEIYKAGHPQLRSIFNWSDLGPSLNAEELRRQGRARARLIPFAGPPAGIPRVSRRAIVAMRTFIFPGKADSRVADMGPRFVSAMNAYGWRASHFGMTFIENEKDYVDMAAQCVQEKADVLFLDDWPVLSPVTHEPRAAMIAELRRTLPNLKVVSVHLDPWAIDRSTLISTSAVVDAVWAPFPANPVLSEPALVDKIVFVMFPHAVPAGVPVTPLSSRMTFAGGVFGYNWHRIFWLAGSSVYGLPVHLQMSTHTADGLAVLDSYAAYMRRVEASTCSLNLSMRPDLSRVHTGRCYETIHAGALLVQEDADDLDYYFVAGEHYLNFSSASDLRAIARFIAENPDAAEEIRRNGNAFARAHYSDDKVTGYLDKQLFYRT